MEDDGYVYHVFVKSGFDVANKHIGKIRATSPATLGEELDINPLGSPELIQQKDDIPVDNNCFVGGASPELDRATDARPTGLAHPQVFATALRCAGLHLQGGRQRSRVAA